MLKKSLAVGIIFFLVISSVPYSTRGDEISTGTFDGNTLYVGGTGPGNYSKIQDAIDNASVGDTVFVYNGTYYEHVKVRKSISLVGEDKNSTIIDGYVYCFHITIFSDFTIQNSGAAGFGLFSSHSTIISNNVIKSNNIGIFLYNSRNNTIKNNIVKDNKEFGIYIPWNVGCVIENNEISNTTEGTGLKITDANNIVVRKNNISNNKIGLAVVNCLAALWPFPPQRNRIMNNNFFDNTLHAGVRSDDYVSSFLCVRFFHNYWGRTMMLPKIIWKLDLYDNPIYSPCNIDLFPAQEPYDIGGR